MFINVYMDVPRARKATTTVITSSLFIMAGISEGFSKALVR